MKKLTMWILVLVLSLSFTACGEKGNSGDSNSDNEPWTLGVPKLTVDDQATTLSWKKINRALSYTVYIEGPVDNEDQKKTIEVEITENSFDLTQFLFEGTYNVKVMAKGNGANISDSSWATTEFSFGEYEHFAYVVETAFDENFEEFVVTDENGNIPGYMMTLTQVSYTTPYETFVIPATYRTIPVVKIYMAPLSVGEVVMSDNLLTVGTQAFIERGVKNIKFSKNLKTIMANGFQKNPIENVILPVGLKTLGNMAFNMCESLKSVFVPASVEEMGTWVFNNCPKLTIYAESESMPEGWTVGQHHWNAENRPIIWGCKISADGTYVESFTKKLNSIENSGDLSAPYREGYSFVGWSETAGSSTAEYSMADLRSVSNGTTLYTVWEQDIVWELA